MNAPTNKEITDSLKACLKYLSPTGEYKEDTSPFICFALSLAAAYEPHRTDTDTDTDTVRYIKEHIISRRIRPYGNLGTWLLKEHGIPKEALGAYKGKRLQTYRRQWVQQLIEEFSR